MGIEEIEFRPVLTSWGMTDGSTCDGGGGDAPRLQDGSGEVVLPGEDGYTCYSLGPVGATDEAIESAEVVLANGTWSVSVEAAEGSRAQMNELFNACYQGLPSCPSQPEPLGGGAVAIVVDRVVISAPIVQVEDLADDTFSVSGNFTEADAARVAVAFDRGR